MKVEIISEKDTVYGPTTDYVYLDNDQVGYLIDGWWGDSLCFTYALPIESQIFVLQQILLEKNDHR